MKCMGCRVLKPTKQLRNFEIKQEQENKKICIFQALQYMGVIRSEDKNNECSTIKL